MSVLDAGCGVGRVAIPTANESGRAGESLPSISRRACSKNSKSGCKPRPHQHRYEFWVVSAVVY